MRVLLVEDDPKTARMVALALMSAGYQCDTVTCVEESMHCVKSYPYEIVIMDLDLSSGESSEGVGSNVSGYEGIHRMRRAGVTIPIMVLTGYSSVEHKVRTWSVGGDEHICKPYHTSELMCRISALIRRSKGHAESTIRIGRRLKIETDNKNVMVDDMPVHFTLKEYMLLEILSMNRNSLVTKESILQQLYNESSAGSKILDVFMCKIRKKLVEATGGVIYIKTMWAKGYRLASEAEILSAEEGIGIGIYGNDDSDCTTDDSSLLKTQHQETRDNNVSELAELTSLEGSILKAK